MLDRRLAPRPLPLHLASATTLWLSSRAALMSWNAGLPPSNPPAASLEALLGEVARVGREQVSAALDRELAGRSGAFLRGVEAYRQHPYRRSATEPPVLWRRGATRLLDYGEGREGQAVFVVPSLINRYHVLDLLPQHSFLRYLAGQGLRPLVVDWGVPGADERGFTLADYILEYLDAAFAVAREAVGSPVAILGYCMGGLLALPLALHRALDTAALALLATPWDFHAEGPEQGALLANSIEAVLGDGSRGGELPVEAIQGLFWALDPFLAERKFARFGGLEPGSAEVEAFVALEDWINDGVPLAGPVALECARDWYRANATARGEWRVDGLVVDPAALRLPVLAVLPSRDRIVPPRSAEALARTLPNATVLRPNLGHIGMMASSTAPESLWARIAGWLRTPSA